MEPMTGEEFYSKALEKARKEIVALQEERRAERLCWCKFAVSVESIFRYGTDFSEGLTEALLSGNGCPSLKLIHEKLGQETVAIYRRELKKIYDPDAALCIPPDVLEREGIKP